MQRLGLSLEVIAAFYSKNRTTGVAMPSIVRISGKINEVLQKIERTIGSAFLGFMLFVMLLNIVFRYILGKPLFWSDELNNYLFIWMGFLACAYVMGSDGHVKVTAMQNLFSPKARDLLNLIMNLTMLGMFAMFVAPTLRLLSHMPKSNSMQIPLKYVYFIIPLSFGLMCLHIVNTIIQDLARLATARHVDRERL